MKIALILLSLLFSFISCDAVCTEVVLKEELAQDIKDDNKLDCLRKVRPKPESEDEEQLKNRLAAVWDSDCAFEAEYDWTKYLKQNYGFSGS